MVKFRCFYFILLISFKNVRAIYILLLPYNCAIGCGNYQASSDNKKVKLLINEKPVYETSYHSSLGKIFGVKISFAGIGVVNDLLLKDLNTGEIFNDGFSGMAAKE